MTRVAPRRPTLPVRPLLVSCLALAPAIGPALGPGPWAQGSGPGDTQVGGGGVDSAPQTLRTVRFASGGVALEASSPEERRAVLETAANGAARHVVVGLERTPSSVFRRRLAAAGLELQAYLGEQSWFAVVDPAVDVDALEALGLLQVAVPVERAWKLHPEFAAGAIPPRAIVEPDATDPTVAAYVLFHRDVALETDGRALVENLQGRVVDVLETIGALVIELPASRVSVLVDQDEVQWLEPPLPPLSDVSMTATAVGAPAPNDSNRVITQADTVQAGPYNLDGSGVSVLVYDGGYALQTHDDFGGRLTVRDSAGLSDHATHVAGTIGGDGTVSGGLHAGMAPNVTMESYGFEYDGSQTFLYTNPGDIESDYTQAINTYGADLSNNSIGTNVEPNGFLCNLQGDYGITSQVLDGVVTGSTGSTFRIIWANGNERQGSSCDIEGYGDYYSTAPPACAKNPIMVGALNSNDDSMTSFSSWGPTDDGRMKPDVSAPGCQSNGDGGVTSTGSASDTTYTVKCGTSMAAPTMTGLAALLIEDWRAQFGGADPLNSTLKALFAHEADDGGNPGPDYQYGYGSVRIQDTIDFMRLARFDEASVAEQDEAYRYTVTVGGGDPELKLTLAWDDEPGTPNVLGSLVNDLDVVVRDPLGNRHWPWTLDPSNPGANASQTQANTRDNLEQVFVGSPMAGTWTVDVHASDLPVGPQAFSLASSHALTAGPFLSIGFPSEPPSVLMPGAATPITATITGVGETLVGGSPTLHYRFDGGAYQTATMSSVGGNQYQANLPGAACSDTPEYYVSATGSASGLQTNPLDAPTTVFSAQVLDLATVFADDFETDTGWTVSNVSLTDGAWDRGVPAGGGDRLDPPFDFDGSGQCWLTDNVAGNSDVDGGPTRITSPSFDLSGGLDYTVSYARWFGNNSFDADDLLVEISNNGGSSWTTVESTGETFGWTTFSFDVASFVTPTNDVVLRFSATDNPNDSVTEAALDDFRILSAECIDLTPIADFSVDVASGEAPLAVNFTDTTSGNVTSWSWDFGDGNVSSAQNPAHTYDCPGTFTVSLTVSGPSGGDTETKTSYVVATKPPQVGTNYGTSTAGSLGAPTMTAFSNLTTGSELFLYGGNTPPATTVVFAISPKDMVPAADLSNGLMQNVGLPIVIFSSHTADPNGDAIYKITLPASLSGLSIYSQAITIDGTGGDAFATSLGLRVDIP